MKNYDGKGVVAWMRGVMTQLGGAILDFYAKEVLCAGKYNKNHWKKKIELKLVRQFRMNRSKI